MKRKNRTIPAALSALTVIMAILTGVGHEAFAKEHVSTKQNPAKVTQKKKTVSNNSANQKNMVPKAKDGFSLEISEKYLDASRLASARSLKAIQKAQALFDAGDIQGAKSAYVNAASLAPLRSGLQPAYPQQTYLLGKIALADGNVDEALQRFLDYQQTSYTNDGLELNIALCYIRKGDYERAGEIYKKWIDENVSESIAQDLPGTTGSQVFEASILAVRALNADSMGQYEKAVRDYTAASRLAPNNALILHRKGLSLMKARRGEEAVTAFKQVLQLGNSPYTEEAKQQITGIERYQNSRR
ncbi:MAG: tetratricopeptide repeat protein [Proteobacteria bacterium]|nr:MAG: tetratricopeptide repeat protein [Pseudomonadota bacterium]